MFDLETSITAWRHRYIQSRTFFDEDLDELERHLRDHVDHLLIQGLPEEEAFRTALQGIGDYFEAEEEYRRIYWQKLKHRHARMREITWKLAMFKNYLKVIFRNLYKHKGYAFINIAGLGIGLACCFLIVLYVQHESSFDAFHENADRLYRVLRASRQDVTNRTAVSASGYANDLKEFFPEMEQVVRFWTNTSVTLRKDTETRTAGRVAFVDPNVFDAFSFSLQRGDPATALEAPRTMVLTEEAAAVYFGNQNPVGQTLTMLQGENQIEMQITGILDVVPGNSHLQFDYLFSFNTLLDLRGPDALTDYVDYNYYTYVLLAEGVSPESITDRSEEFLLKTRGEQAAQNSTLVYQPITDIHLTTDIGFDLPSNSEKKYLYIFGGVAILILLIASINFMNLSTARATLRAKEVGVRKVIGAYRTQLILQFFGESLLASALGIAVAFVLLLASAPFLAPLMGDAVALPPRDGRLIAVLIAIGLLTGLLAGVYPAFVLSSFNPARVLKGEVTQGKRGAMLRKGLIIFQFGISVFLIISMTTVYRQLNFMKAQDLGFDKEQVVFLSLSADLKSHFEAFRQNLLNRAGIQHVALAGNVPGRVNTSRGYMWPGDEEEDNMSVYTMLADHHTIDTFGLELIAGRNFSPDLSSDSTHAYILNETAVRRMGWENPVDHPFRAWDSEMGRVIGVVKDFHYKSLHQQIEPIVFDIKADWSWQAAIRVSPDRISESLSAIEEEWKHMEPTRPFTYRFLDEDFDRLYRSEERLGQLFSYFTILAILVACLGLFGLVSFVAEQRRKEISIRKVLGASLPQLLFLIARDFSILVILAAAVASPFAYWAMSRWLEGFAYQIGQSVWTFLFVGLAVLIVALITVSYQSIKAALSDPAEILRYE